MKQQGITVPAVLDTLFDIWLSWDEYTSATALHRVAQHAKERVQKVTARRDPRFRRLLTLVAHFLPNLQPQVRASHSQLRNPLFARHVACV